MPKNQKLPSKNRRRRIIPLPPGKETLETLEYQLCEVLMKHAGERGDDEGAVDTLCRIIHERDRALTVLALGALEYRRPGGPMRQVEFFFNSGK